MKSLMQFWRVAAEEMAASCRASTTVKKSLERDFATLDSRIEHEGLSFLTITLPAYGKDFERSLESGQVDPHLVFHSWKFRGGLPAFLGGFLDQVFDRRSGDLLDDPCHFSIKSIRQLTLMFGKMQLECTEERTHAALADFIQIDREVAMNDQRYLGSPEQEKFKRFGLMLFADVLSKLDKDVYDHQIVPKHGPGNTADRLTGNGKYNQVEWTHRLEAIFSYGEYVLPSWRHKNRFDDVLHFLPDEERPARVTTVIKTQKRPRVIALEPTGMQYIQQGLMAPLVTYIEADKILGAVIGFTQQSPNQELACEGSLYGSLATLDLSEASDRVSFQHVKDLLHRFPFVREAVDASRSRRAGVPAHYYHGPTVVELSKFASMGSALCFPFEAMVFTTVIAMAIDAAKIAEHGPAAAAQRRHEIQRLLDGVRVYGDDIIVPAHYATTVVRYLELFGFKVNTSKSFWRGKFRESCGKEFYAGTDVSIVRVRQEFPVPRRLSNVQKGSAAQIQNSRIVSAVSLRNQLWLAGLYNSAAHLDVMIEKILPIYPVVTADSALLGRLSFEDPTVDGWEADTHVPLVKGYAVKATPPRSDIETMEAALMKYFLKRGEAPLFDKKHYERAGRPDAVYLKRRRATVSLFGNTFLPAMARVFKQADHKRTDMFR